MQVCCLYAPPPLPSSAWPPLWISCVSLRLYTVCFLNHVQISPSSPIKSSNPFGAPPPPPSWKTVPHQIVIYFHCARGKICSVCVCGCVKGPQRLGCEPLLSRVLTPNTGPSSPTATCVRVRAAEFAQRLHAARSLWLAHIRTGVMVEINHRRF